MWEINGKKTTNEAEVAKAFGLKYAPMVKSLLDLDAYKISMGQCYHHQFGKLRATWDFKARNVGAHLSHEKYTAEDIKEIKKQILAYCALRFDDEELCYLREKLPWIKEDYTNFLKFWHPERGDFLIEEDEDFKTGLSITFAGVQEYVEYYEIPVLEICAEVYYRNHYDYYELLKNFKEKTEEKIAVLKTGKYHTGTWSEFGARRRLSFEAQDWLVGRLAEENLPGFVGTSDIFLARKYGVTPVGTMAHEFFQCIQGGMPEVDPAYSNKFALDAWVKEYGVWNGIALTDTLGTNLFLRDFGKTYSTLFSGVRNDSGDPFEWTDKMIEHYRRLGIDSKQKTLLFSNSINSLELWDKLCRYTEGRAKPAFGIGTYWSGPQDIVPLNIVAKVVLVNGRDVAKLSDDAGKCMCRNAEYVDYLKRTIDWRLEHETNTNYYID